jgi:hypothetical protein
MNSESSKLNDFILMPLSELETPHEGRMVYLGRWWRVTENNEVLFYKTYSSPQCNIHKSIAERISSKIKNSRVVFVPVAYIPYSGLILIK